MNSNNQGIATTSSSIIIPTTNSLTTATTIAQCINSIFLIKNLFKEVVFAIRIFLNTFFKFSV